MPPKTPPPPPPTPVSWCETCGVEIPLNTNPPKCQQCRATGR